MIFSAALFAALPVSALARGPVPPVFVNPPQVYVVHGPLSHYVPSHGLTEGSITIRVDQTNSAAAFALNRTLTFRVKAATVVSFDAAGWINDGDTGSVRLTSSVKLTSVQALQTAPAASVTVDQTKP